MKTAAELNGLLAQTATRRGVPGGVFGLWQAGSEVVVPFGVLNTDTGVSVGKDSMFQIGSITKVLTATLVMQLFDQGRVALDEPVRTYLPEFRVADLDASQTVTVRQLLTHTSGLAGDFMTDTGAGSDAVARFVDRCALLPLAHPVGQGFSYSNAAFNVAGRIVEVVTGQPFDVALKRAVFEPLGLAHSLISLVDVPGRSVSSGHVPDVDHPLGARPLSTLYTLPFSAGPAGSTTLMSAGDLIAFARAHLEGGVAPNGARLIKPETAALMREPQVRIPVPPRDIAQWGLGWFLLETPTGTLFGHDGATVGQSAFLRIHEPTGTIAVLLVNGGAANDAMMDIFAEAFDPLTGVHPSAAPIASGVAGENLDRYVGVYETVAGRFDIYLEDGRLMRRGGFRIDDLVIDEPPVALDLVSEDTFIYVRPSAEHPALVSFLEPDETGRPQVMFSGLRVARRT